MPCSSGGPADPADRPGACAPWRPPTSPPGPTRPPTSPRPLPTRPRRAPTQPRSDAGQPRRRDRRPGALPRPGPVRPRPAGAQGILLDAAREETDHLAWCESAFASSAAAPACSTRCGTRAPSASARSPGCAATAPASVSWPRPSARSKSTCESHLRRLPAEDLRSRAIVERMRDDEVAPWRSGAPVPARASLPEADPPR